ncbi:MAG: hypothetical protein H6820_09215 [Phycisphaerales bacterium]|nr:hypothetical protein [Phycisphaerales bacterium]
MTTRRERAVAIAHPVPHQRQTVLWIIAILLAIIATALIVRPDGFSMVQPANANPSMLGARGIFAFTGQLDENSYGLFMMDVDSSNVWVYQYKPGTKKLKLVAARSFLYDRYLEEFQNDAETSPNVVKGLLDTQRHNKARISGGGVAATRADTPLHTDLPGSVDVFQEKGQMSSPQGTMTPDPAG